MTFPIITRSPGIFRRLFPILPAIFLAFGGCGEDRPASSGPTLEIPAGPDQVFVNARFVVTENGATNAVIRADSVEVYQDRGLSVASGNLRVELYSREGERISTLTAARGIVYGMTEDIDSLRAEGDVLVTWHRRNATMETPFIRWVAGTRMIYADSTVVLSVDTAVERGVGFAAPDDLKSYTMGRVTGVVEDQQFEIPGR